MFAVAAVRRTGQNGVGDGGYGTARGRRPGRGGRATRDGRLGGPGRREVGARSPDWGEGTADGFLGSRVRVGTQRRFGDRGQGIGLVVWRRMV